MKNFYLLVILSVFLLSCETTEPQAEPIEEKILPSEEPVVEISDIDDMPVQEEQNIPSEAADTITEDESAAEVTDLTTVDSLLETAQTFEDVTDSDIVLSSEDEILEEDFGIEDEAVVEASDLTLIDSQLETPQVIEDGTAINTIVEEDIAVESDELVTDNFETEEVQNIEDEIEQSAATVVEDAPNEESLVLESEPEIDAANTNLDNLSLDIPTDTVIEPITQDNPTTNTVIEDEIFPDTPIVESEAIQGSEIVDGSVEEFDNTEQTISSQAEQDVQAEITLSVDPVIDNEQASELDSVIITDSGDVIFEDATESDVLSYEHIAPIISPEEASETQEYEEIRQPVIISQTVEAFKDDYVDITLPGQGWIYLGETKETNPPILDFTARYINGDDTLFNFYAENVGNTILHFYKQDVIADEYVDEYVEVIIRNFNTPNIPSSARSQSNAEEMFGISAEPEVALVSGGSEITEETIFIPEQLLDDAEMAFNESRFEDSIDLLDEYTSLGVDEIDRALFLYGQNYESSSEQRNIRQALSSYEKIIESFPDSDYWDEASKRITYLERFYLNIR